MDTTQNATKTWLIVKEESYVQAQAVFRGSGVSITKEGKRHLGAAIGNDAFKEEYVREKVVTWVEELERLTRIAESQPHAAYAAFTHGLVSKCSRRFKSFSATRRCYPTTLSSSSHRPESF